MYDDELLTNSQQASPASVDESSDIKDFPSSSSSSSPKNQQQQQNQSSSSSKSKLASVDEILEKYHQKYHSPSSTTSKDQQQNQQLLDNDPELFQQLGSVITKRAVHNKESVRKGVISFSKSTAYLTSELSKGPLSDHDIKWMEVGLMINQQPSPIRDSLFKVQEVLVDVGKALEGIEAASQRYAVAKKRREMLVEQRDKLLRIAASRQNNKNTKQNREESPVPDDETTE